MKEQGFHEAAMDEPRIARVRVGGGKDEVGMDRIGIAGDRVDRAAVSSRKLKENFDGADAPALRSSQELIEHPLRLSAHRAQGIRVERRSEEHTSELQS